MWEWLAEATKPVPRGDMLTAILLVLILGFAVTAWAFGRP